MADWLQERKRVTTIEELRAALFYQSPEMELLGTHDGGFGIADDIFVGIQVTKEGKQLFVIDVEDALSSATIEYERDEPIPILPPTIITKGQEAGHPLQAKVHPNA